MGRVYRGMFEGDRRERGERFREALEIARRFGDTDLEFCSPRLPRSEPRPRRPHRGRHAAARRSVRCRRRTRRRRLLRPRGDLLSAVLGVRARARRRARRSVDPDRRGDRASAAPPGRLGVLPDALRRRPHAAGRWTEADAALTEAVRCGGSVTACCARARSIRLADLRVRQGRSRRPSSCSTGSTHYTEAARPLAALHLARGEAARAEDVLERALEPDGPVERGCRPAVGAARRRPPRPWRHRRRPCSASSDSRSARSGTRATTCSATAALARGQLCLADGSGDPRRACGRRSPGSRGRRCRWSSPAPGSSSPRTRSLTVPRSRSLRQGRARSASSGSGRPARRRRRRAAPGARGPGSNGTEGQRGRHAHEERDRGPRAARARPVQPRDQRPAVHQPEDRRAPRRATSWRSSDCAAGPKPPLTPLGASERPAGR